MSSDLIVAGMPAYQLFSTQKVNVIDINNYKQVHVFIRYLSESKHCPVPFIIKFSMDKCPPCVAMAPKFDALCKQAQHYGMIQCFLVHEPGKNHNLWKFIKDNKIMGDDEKDEIGFPSLYYKRPGEQAFLTHNIVRAQEFVANIHKQKTK